MVMFISFFISAAYAGTVLITGSNSGIGLEFAKQYAEKGWTVYATHRRDETPDTLSAMAKKYKNVFPERMDVTKANEIKSLALKLKNVPIDVLINNAGIFNKEKTEKKGDTLTIDSAQVLGTLDYDFYDEVMDVNAKGPVRITEAFIEHLKKGNEKKVIAISSYAAIHGRPPFAPGSLWYSVSKAALNKSMNFLSYVLKNHGIIVGILNPGAVNVERVRDLGFKGLLSTEESVRGMRNVIENLTMDKSGEFYNHKGEREPW